VKKNNSEQHYIEILDTSSSFVLGGVSLYFQVNSLNSLKSQLDRSNDPITKLQVISSYTSMILTTTELFMQGAKLVSLSSSSSVQLFLGRNTNLYTFLNKYLKGVNVVGKVIAVIDSLLTLAQSIKSLNERNSGAGVFVATSVLGVVMTIASVANVVPLWGQIAFIVIGIGAAIITSIYYSDGTDWDEIDKWLNRSMLGKFDQRELYPPYYLPTPVCMQLSQQDYYLAVNGGRCLIEYESSLISNKYDLYLVLNLPDFHEQKSEFKATVTIDSLQWRMPTAKLDIVYKEGQVLTTQNSGLELFSLATEQSLDSKKEIYEMNRKEAKEVSDDELLWVKLMSEATGKAPSAATPPNQNNNKNDDTNSQIGLFLIRQRLGVIKVTHKVAVSINYWPNGSEDKEGKAITPYLLSYHYKKD